jgi:hypothetical protein
VCCEVLLFTVKDLGVFVITVKRIATVGAKFFMFLNIKKFYISEQWS